MTIRSSGLANGSDIGIIAGPCGCGPLNHTGKEASHDFSDLDRARGARPATSRSRSGQLMRLLIGQFAAALVPVSAPEKKPCGSLTLPVYVCTVPPRHRKGASPMTSTQSTLDPHPGDAEALAAAAAMRELYGSPAQGEGRMRGGRLVSTYAVGDTISWLTPEGYRQGVVIEVLDEDANVYHVVERRPGGARIHHAVDGDAIAPF